MNTRNREQHQQRRAHKSQSVWKAIEDTHRIRRLRVKQPHLSAHDIALATQTEIDLVKRTLEAMQ